MSTVCSIISLQYLQSAVSTVCSIFSLPQSAVSTRCYISTLLQCPARVRQLKEELSLDPGVPKVSQFQYGNTPSCEDIDFGTRYWGSNYPRSELLIRWSVFYPLFAGCWLSREPGTLITCSTTARVSAPRTSTAVLTNILIILHTSYCPHYIIITQNRTVL